LTTAAAAVEEQTPALVSGAALTAEVSVPALRVPSVAAPQAASRPAGTHLILGTILLVQTGWLAVLGFFVYKLV
jgi:hypothetical protein